MLPLLVALALTLPTTYVVDGSQTELLALTAPAGLFAGASHPHVLQARQVTGVVVFDATRPEATLVEVKFPADALENDDPALRARVGFTSTLSPQDRATVAANLRAKGQLDVATYPVMSFQTTGARSLGPGRLELSGTLTVRGVAVALKLPVRVEVADGVLRGYGTVGLTHAMFGFAPYVTGLGTIRNAEEVALRVTLVARAGKPAAP
jgi:polyisoprenoid-binding protein YceI